MPLCHATSVLARVRCTSPSGAINPPQASADWDCNRKNASADTRIASRFIIVWSPLVEFIWMVQQADDGGWGKVPSISTSSHTPHTPQQPQIPAFYKQILRSYYPPSHSIRCDQLYAAEPGRVSRILPFPGPDHEIRGALSHCLELLLCNVANRRGCLPR